LDCAVEIHQPYLFCLKYSSAAQTHSESQDVQSVHWPVNGRSWFL
jgi:hypothetical protein